VYTITATIINTGKVAGDEVAQLYVSLGGENDAPRVLRGFDRLKNIPPGGSATFTVNLCRKDIMNWSPEIQDWYIGSGTKTVYVGGSSRNLPLTANLPLIS
jgi:beta-glucosidase